MVASSVVIPTSNNSSGLTKTLQALINQTFKPDQVVVIEYGRAADQPATNTLSFTFDGDLNLSVLDHPDFNLSQARNAGVDAATGELIIFLEDWTVPHPRLIEQHVTEHARKSADQLVTVGLIEWKAPLGADLFRAHLLAETGGQLFAFRTIRRYLSAGYQFCYASNLAVSKNLLLEEKACLGYIFDPHFGPVYGDIELGYRLEQRQIKMRYLASAAAYISEPFDLADMAERQFQKGRAASYMAGKHPELLNSAELKLAAASDLNRTLTLDYIAALNKGLSDFEQIVAIDTTRFEIHHKPVSKFLDQILAAIYNSLLEAYYAIGVAAGQVEKQAVDGIPAAGLEYYLKTLPPGSVTDAAYELRPHFMLPLTPDEQLIYNLRVLLHEKNIEEHRLNLFIQQQLTAKNHPHEPALPYLADLQQLQAELITYRDLAAQRLESFNHYREIANHQIEIMYQIRQTSEEYLSKFQEAQAYASHVEAEYQKLLAQSQQAVAAPASGSIKKISQWLGRRFGRLLGR